VIGSELLTLLFGVRKTRRQEEQAHTRTLTRG
jgi:hypothetical protein